MGDTNEYTVHDLVRDELYKNMDVEYGKFTASLSPGAGNIIGVRIPVLRKMAKEIASVNWKEYLDGARDDTFEEVMLQGIVLGYARGKIDDILTYMGRFIPKIDDWSICDTCCNTFKIANQYQQEVWDFLMPYLDEQGVIDGKPANERNREFELRFVAVMMLNYYLKMGVAWGLAEAYVKCPEPTKVFLNNNHLDDFTFNKAIQKMQESFRITPEEKAALKAMKR